MNIRTGLYASLIVLAGLSLAPSSAHAMAAAPAWLHANTSLPTSTVEVIPANTVIPVYFDISDNSLEGKIYPYTMQLNVPTGNFGDVLEMPLTHTINFPGEVVTFTGSITTSAMNGTRSYLYSMYETTAPNLTIQICYPITFAIGAPTPTATTSPTSPTKGKGGGGKGNR